jgi:hypothetical protein
MTGAGQLQTGSLGFIIAAVIVLGLGGVVGTMCSLFVANLRQGARARELAAQAREETLQRLSASRPQDIRALLGAASIRPDSGAIRLDVRLPPEAMRVFAIESELHELLAKVMAYAAGVMRAGATLQLSAHADREQAVIHWRDLDAVDMHPPLAKFFDSRHSAAVVASARACERIAGHHGGRIYSAPLGGGVLGLTLRLPLLKG